MKINFHIPDFVRHMKLNLILADTLRQRPECFYDGVNIGSVYGTFPTSMWNGGRLFCGTIDPRMIDYILRQFNARGIPCRYTFSNPLITEEVQLKDEFCNHCLKIAENGLNEVIVLSPQLEQYIRKNYPKYPLISSTCKQIEDIDDVISELNKDYKFVVLDYNWNNQFDVLEKLPHKEKCEILINACCTPHCKRRKEHYYTIAKQQIDLAKHFKYTPNKPITNFQDFSCPQMALEFYETTKLSIHVTPEDIYNKYAPMGFVNFKIEGRHLSDVAVLESYMYYLVKPQYRDEIRLHILLLLFGQPGSANSGMSTRMMNR